MNCVIEFYTVGAQHPAALIELSGELAPEDTSDRFGVVSKIRLLSDMLATLPEGSKCDDPEWAAAEYVTLFRKMADSSIRIALRRKPQIAYVYKVMCTMAGLKVMVLRREEGQTFRQVA